MAASRQRLLARLHCLKREFGWSEEEYRTALHTHTGRHSAAELDISTLAALVARLGKQQPSRARPVAAEWAWIVGHREERTLRALIAACDRAGIAAGSQVRYCEAMLAQRRGCTQPLRMCAWRDFRFVFAALKGKSS